MSIEGHISELERKHQQLEQKLHEVKTSLAGQDAELLQIKRKKLKIKDELSKMTGSNVAKKQA